MNKIHEIKNYFNTQNDWSTLTEFEYFKWLIEKVDHYEYVLKGIGQNADNTGNHLRANNALGIINMKGRGTYGTNRNTNRS